MIVSKFNKKQLAQLVLASTLLVTPVAFAMVFTDIVGSQTTADNRGIVEVAFDGQIVSDASNDGNAVTVNSPGFGVVITDPFNSTAGQMFSPGTFMGPQDGRYAIFATTTGTNGILVDDIGDAEIKIGAGSGVTTLSTTMSDDDAILVDSTYDTFILNLGTIQAVDAAPSVTGHAIRTTDSGDIVVDNQFSGVIQSGGRSSIYINSKGADLILINAGVIQRMLTSNDDDAIHIKTAFSELINRDFGRILHGTSIRGSSDGDTIKIDPESVTNNGILINEYGGLISQNDTEGTGDAIEISGDNSGMLLKNAGTIQNVGTGSAIYLDSGAALGLIVNEHTGVISSFGTTIYAENSTTIGNSNSPFGLVNYGIITTLAQDIPSINFSGTSISVGIDQRGGTITGQISLADHDSQENGNTFRMSGGTVAGDVVAKSAISNTIELSGGRLLGTLFLGNLGDTVNLSGDATVINIVGGTGDNTFNVYGGSITNLFGDTPPGGINTLNILRDFVFNGGVIDRISQIFVGPEGPVTFVVNGNITNFAGIGTSELYIYEGSKLILGAGSNMTSAGLKSQVINDGVLLVPKGTPTIDLTSNTASNVRMQNNGILFIGHDAVLNLVTNGDPTDSQPSFYSSDNSALRINVAGVENEYSIPSSGQLWVYPTTVANAPNGGNIVLDKGSFIQPVIEGFIPHDQRYNIVYDISERTIYDGSTLMQPHSAVISFSKHLTGPDHGENILQLITHRHSYSSLANEGTEGIAEALDHMAASVPSVYPEFLPNNPWGFHHHHHPDRHHLPSTFLRLLAALDQLPTREEVVNALDSLQFFNNGALSRVTFNAMDNVFDATIARVEDLMMPGYKMAPQGVNYGDTSDRGGLWVEALGAYLQQNNRDVGSDRHHHHDGDDHHHGKIPGYKASAVGVAVGADWAVSNCVLLGLAGSYLHSDVDGKGHHHHARKDADINSWQATAYGWFQLHPVIYVDAAIGLATNDFDTKRHIPIADAPHDDHHHHRAHHTVAKGSFDGTTWGAQADLGWLAIDNESYFFAPFARLRWYHLALDDVREKGAGDLGLHVRHDDSNALLGGVGFRFGGKYGTDDIQYIPELTAMVAYDFDNDGNNNITSTFLGDPNGVFTFVSENPDSNRTSFNVGLGLAIHIDKRSIFSVKYNLALRDEFFGNSGFVKYYYIW